MLQQLSVKNSIGSPQQTSWPVSRKRRGSTSSVLSLSCVSGRRRAFSQRFVHHGKYLHQTPTAINTIPCRTKSEPLSRSATISSIESCRPATSPPNGRLMRNGSCPSRLSGTSVASALESATSTQPMPARAACLLFTNVLLVDTRVAPSYGANIWPISPKSRLRSAGARP